MGRQEGSTSPEGSEPQPTYRVLGPLVVEGVSGGLGPPKQRALLGYLLLHAGEVLTTDRLIDALWGEGPPRTARHSIQTYVSGLRSALGPDVIVTEPDGYRLDVHPSRIDWCLFEAEAARARSLDPEQQRVLLEDAFSLWRGHVLEGLEDHVDLTAVRARVEEHMLSARELWAEAVLVSDTPQDLIPPLEALVATHPYRESLWQLLMLGQDQSGSPAEALKTYQRLRRVLVEDLGIDPSAELQALENEILLRTTTQPPETQAASRPASFRIIRQRHLMAALAIVVLATVVYAMATRSDETVTVTVLREPGQATFNDLLSTGLSAASLEYPIHVQDIPLVDSPTTMAEEAIAGGTDIIVLAGPGVFDALDAAEDAPDVRFVVLGVPSESTQSGFDLPNVTALEFSVAHGPFLMGAAAASQTATGVIGFVGAMPTSPILRALAAFEAGAKEIDPDVRVLVSYIRTDEGATAALEAFGSPAAGSEVATLLINEGADVLFHEAGSSGAGVLDAILRHSSEQRPLLFLAPGADEWLRAGAIERDRFLTTVVHRSDEAIRWVLDAYFEESLPSGRVTVGFAEQSVCFAGLGSHIGDHEATLDALRTMVVTGEVPIPSVPSSAVRLVERP